jgi:hypothetical protein
VHDQRALKKKEQAKNQIENQSIKSLDLVDFEQIDNFLDNNSSDLENEVN